MGVTSGQGTAYPSGSPEFTPVLSGVRVTRSLVLKNMICRSLFVLLYLFLWSLCCLFIFVIRILITPLASSNSSYSKSQINLTNNGYLIHYLFVSLWVFFAFIVLTLLVSPDVFLFSSFGVEVL